MRVLPPVYGLAVGDAAISPSRGAPTTRDQLVELAFMQEHRRGRARLALLLPLVDPLAESVGESISRGVILWSGFEPPELQLVFRSDGFTDRVDFAWRTVRAIGESDGYEKYIAAPGEDPATPLIAEKLREERLRRLCDSFDRWDFKTAVAVTPLVQRLDAMRVPRVAPPRPRLLHVANPRSLTIVRERARHGKRDEDPTATAS